MTQKSVPIYALESMLCRHFKAGRANHLLWI